MRHRITLQLFSSSIPQESDLVELHTLVLSTETYGVEQLVVLNGQALTGSPITVVDSRTTRVHLTIEEDFFNEVPVGESIELSGFATVRDASLGTTISTQFALDLEITEDVSSSNLMITNL